VENLEEKPGTEPGASPNLCSSKQTQDSPTTLYLFGRTGREKEEWFHHLLLASKDTESEKERDRQRAGRCVSQSGMRNDNRALWKRREGL